MRSRRSSALMLTLALVASSLGLATLSTAEAVSFVTVAPGDTPDTGNFYVAPEPYSEGQAVKLTANFPDGIFMVTFYKETAPDTWTSIGTDESNAQGNAYLNNYVVNGDQNLYARAATTPDEGRTEVKALTPLPPDVILPNGPQTGSLTESPTTFVAGDNISLTANFPSGSFPITLYKEGPANVWSVVSTKASNSSGDATFTAFPVTSSTQRVFARKANNDRTEVDVIAPAPKTTLSIRRDCTGTATGSDCASTATAYVELDPAQEGRVFKLQYKSGSSWVSVSGATPAAPTTGADGKVQITFPVGTLSQWSTRTYRATTVDTPAVTSPEIQFMPGPTKLGSNVLSVDVDKGAYPTSKSAEYTGKATLSTNGVVELDHVALENFGVRGSSTASFEKKPYKLKFLDKPPSGKSVFGMPRAKSWSLLANYLDRSNVRDKVGLELGRKLDKISWTPQSRYVELFVNDQYRGAYLMTESVKIDKDRVDVDESQGMIMETDGTSVTSGLGFKSSKGIVFLFKDPDERKTNPDGTTDQTGVTSAKLTAITNRVNAFESKLYSSSTREQYPTFIDVDSAIDFYLVKEFTKDRDADFYRSNYFSWDPSGRVGKPLSDGKFHFGPAWDFDRSAGITSENDAVHKYVANPEGFYLRGTGAHDHPNYTTHWFVQLFKSSTFKAKVHQRWLDVRDGVFAQADEEAQASATAVGVGAENDRKRWTGSRQYVARGTYQQEVDYVANWYKKRWTWLNANL